MLYVLLKSTQLISALHPHMVTQLKECNMNVYRNKILKETCSARLCEFPCPSAAYSLTSVLDCRKNLSCNKSATKATISQQLNK